MSHTSSVKFQNDTRVHVGFHTSDLDKAITFYRLLLGCDPVKVKPDYAKFETDDPSVNLSLTAGGKGGAGGAHYGIQVKSTDAVEAAKKRFENAGVAFHSEEQGVCCYALQDKFWIADPDGNEWEVFVVLEDADTFRSESSDCCQDEETESATACC